MTECLNVRETTPTVVCSPWIEVHTEARAASIVRPVHCYFFLCRKMGLLTKRLVLYVYLQLAITCSENVQALPLTATT